jgi:hypothetical protein
MRELDRIRQVELTAAGRPITLITRRTPHQRRILDAVGVNTSSWDKATIS